MIGTELRDGLGFRGDMIGLFNLSCSVWVTGLLRAPESSKGIGTDLPDTPHPNLKMWDRSPTVGKALDFVTLGGMFPN